MAVPIHYERIEIKCAKEGSYDILFRGRDPSYRPFYSVARGVDREDIPHLMEALHESVLRDLPEVWDNRTDLKQLPAVAEFYRIKAEGE